jgi:hypothetical protein
VTESSDSSAGFLTTKLTSGHSPILERPARDVFPLCAVWGQNYQQFASQNHPATNDYFSLRVFSLRN